MVQKFWFVLGLMVDRLLVQDAEVHPVVVVLLVVVLQKLFLFLCCTTVLVSSMKPITNLQVSFRGESYVIEDGCTTVEELTERFEQVSGMTGLRTPRLFWKEKILKPGESLSNAGVEPGDKVLILPVAEQAKVQDVLAIYLVLLSNNNSLENWFSTLSESQIESVLEVFGDAFAVLDNLTPKDVADGLRREFDVAYHRIRSCWEHEAFRRRLRDPDYIEAIRRVVSSGISRNLLQQSPPRLQKALNSKQVWRREFLKAASSILRLGDTVLDGVLDLLLDVLKGKGSSARYATDERSTSSRFDSPQFSSTSAAVADPRMEDPSLANELIYELSESEEEDDLD
jgi:hypothetical protein